MKNNEFKRFRVIPNVGILDDLTGEIYTTNRDICNLLNNEDNQRNEIAEKYYDLLYK